MKVLLNQSLNRSFRLHTAGMTLLEMVIAILILSILTIGTMGYQYFSTRMAQAANAEIIAGRTARLILDNWKKTGGDENFDLDAFDTSFTQVNSSSLYRAVVDKLPLTAKIEWKDVDNDAAAGVTLRQIQVTIQWRSDYQNAAIRNADPSYIATTYVRCDEAGS